jgi:hypothetical protein
MAKYSKSFFDPFDLTGSGGSVGGGTPFSGFFYDPSEDNASAQEGVDQIKEAYNDLETPEYSPVGYVGPDEANNISFDPAEVSQLNGTAYDQVAVDPQYKAAQIAQLNALSELRDRGGLNLTDKANLNKIANDEASREQSQRGAIMQNAQMRGVGRGNQALMAQLNASQQSAARQSQRDMDIAGMAQDRALQAGNAAAGLAGNMSNQDFGQQAQVASARDNAAKFNAQMSNQGAQFNAQGNLTAQQANMNKSQGVNNARAVASNASQEMNNFRMPTQAFQNSATKAGGLASAGKAQTDYYGQKAAAGQAAQGGMWGGLMQLGGGLLSNLGKGGSTGSTGMNSGPGNMNGEQPQWNATNGSSGNYGLGLPETQQTPEDEYNYAHGGRVPGRAMTYGDSRMNDIVMARLSPGEVVVPRSMTKAPSEEIGEFVHNPDKKKAMLSALKNMRRGVR